MACDANGLHAAGRSPSRRRTLLCASTLAGLATLASVHGAAAQEAAQNAGCAALAQPGQFPNTVVSSAKVVPANPATKLPA